MVSGGPSDQSGTASGSGAGAEPELFGGDAEAVGRLRDFAARHGGEAVAVIDYLGRNGARIVLIAPDGRFGDEVVSSMKAATQACRRAGIEVREWDRELTSRITPTPADRVQMGTRGH
jgi:hypothetical protein